MQYAGWSDAEQPGQHTGCLLFSLANRVCVCYNKHRSQRTDRGGWGMKHQKHKLIVQIAVVILPLFALLAVIISWIMYRSTIRGFLEARNFNMSKELNDTYTSTFGRFSEDEDDVCNWYLQYWIEHPDRLKDRPSGDELDYYYARYVENQTGYAYSYDWLISLPDDAQDFFARDQYSTFVITIYAIGGRTVYDSIFCMNMTEPHPGLMFLSYQKNNDPAPADAGQDVNTEDIYLRMQSNEQYQINGSEHPELKKIMETDSEQIVFEKVRNFPREGTYYIGYKPIVLNGKVQAVLGIVYDFNQFRTQLKDTFIQAILISLCGILIVLLILYIALYRLAVRPISDIENALVSYTGHKNSKTIVKNMYDIKVKNEIGYLADVISDFALDIDHYITEIVKIATERERTEKKLYEAQVAVMVSQIQPHFMYNALSSIAILCKLNPDTAYTATVTFSDYLRGNMDSLKQTAPVPFTKELEHLKKYLYIEKLRFDDMLNIEYDIQTTDFEVPLLSVQPLVENAVKHGVGMKENGGTVRIVTRETETAYEIIISDDGVGFDLDAPKQDDGRSHIGMENTRKRLKDMCNADIVITSKIGEGTTATVIIPKQKETEKS